MNKSQARHILQSAARDIKEGLRACRWPQAQAEMAERALQWVLEKMENQAGQR